MVEGVATPAQTEAQQRKKPDHHYDERAFVRDLKRPTGHRIRVTTCCFSLEVNAAFNLQQFGGVRAIGDL